MTGKVQTGRAVLGPVAWLRNRGRFWVRRDLPYSVAFRAAASELEPERWAPKWEVQPAVFKDRIIEAMRLRAVALACDGRSSVADAFGDAADKLEERRGQ